MRIAVLIEDRCKPNSPNFHVLAKICRNVWCRMHPSQWKQMQNPRKRLPSLLGPSQTLSWRCSQNHQSPRRVGYRPDSPLWRKWIQVVSFTGAEETEVVGILGANGMGKSTAINLLSGTLRPNLGDWLVGDLPWEEVLQAFPRGELRDFMTNVAENGVRIAVKPQYVDKIPKAFRRQGECLIGTNRSAWRH